MTPLAKAFDSGQASVVLLVSDLGALPVASGLLRVHLLVPVEVAMPEAWMKEQVHLVQLELVVAVESVQGLEPLTELP